MFWSFCFACCNDAMCINYVIVKKNKFSAHQCVDLASTDDCTTVQTTVSSEMFLLNLFIILIYLSK